MDPDAQISGVFGPAPAQAASWISEGEGGFLDWNSEGIGG